MQVQVMHKMFLKPRAASRIMTLPPPQVTTPAPVLEVKAPTENDVVAEHVTDLAGYLADSSSSSESDDDTEDMTHSTHSPITSVSTRLPSVPPLKRPCRLEIPFLTQREDVKAERRKEMEAALSAIQKLLASKKTKLVSGPHGLQAHRTIAIEIHLRLVLKSGRSFIRASEHAAEASGFAEKWGGRQLHSWTRQWLKKRELPKSERGHHAKIASLLCNPVIAADLRAYVRSNKWSMNPEKLAKFTRNELLPSATQQYAKEVTQHEMPHGLKRYLELEIFPRIHMKVHKGVSLSTTRRWLHREGFRFLPHKKGLYFDGHDRPDVVEYRQNYFLPKMKEYEERLVRFDPADVSKELVVDSEQKNFVERRLVHCAHDEMTAQAHDGEKKSWVFEDHFPLRKKGAGRGIHQSDVVCSTVGWLKGASETIEYGKNHQGFWTGELFVKQVHFHSDCFVHLVHSLPARREDNPCL
jgi:hypothetical protein